MPQTVEKNAFDSIKEFEVIVQEIKTMRDKCTRLQAKPKTDKLAHQKAFILYEVLTRQATLIQQFNQSYLQPADTVEQQAANQLKKVQLRIKMMLALSSSIEKERLDVLAQHRDTSTIFFRASTRVAAVTGGAVGGFSLAGPWGAIVAAIITHQTSSAVLAMEAGLPKSAKHYLKLFRALTNARPIKDKLSESMLTDIRDQVMALDKKKIIWTTEDTDCLRHGSDELHMQFSMDAQYLCRDGANTYNLSPVLKSCGVYRRPDNNSIKLAYISIIIEQAIRTLEPDFADSLEAQYETSSTPSDATSSFGY